MESALESTRLLVVGGHSRGIGKSALVVDLIRAFPEASWVAVKITPHPHQQFSSARAAAEPAFTLQEEHDRKNRTDTSRFLLAGAGRAFWLQVKPERFAEALPALMAELAGARNIIVEGNAILSCLRPALYLLVLDPSRAEFKESAGVYLERADAAILRSPLPRSGWKEAPLQLLEGMPHFCHGLGEPLPASLVSFVRERFFMRGMEAPAHF
jgi:hypothetical protein